MSSLTNGIYFAQISCPTRKHTVLRGFIRPAMENIFDAAAQIGIHGQYLISAEDNTIIGDNYALKYLLERNHLIIVADSLDYLRNDKVSLEISGETATEEEQLYLVKVPGQENEFTSTEGELLRELLQGVTNHVVIAFRKFLSEQAYPKV